MTAFGAYLLTNFQNSNNIHIFNKKINLDMNDMENVTLQNGEIAFLQSGTVIMNVDTAIELSDKLEARQKNTGEQSAEEAMENVMLLLALLFGPEILDKKPTTSKLQKPAPVKPVRDPKDDTHPAPDQDFYFPLPLIGDSVSAKRAFAESPYVYVDNYGNVFGTMSECDYLHQMTPGTTQKLVSGKQHLGYAFGYKGMICDEKKMKLSNFSIYGPYGPKHQGRVRTLFYDKHLVTVVAVHKSEIVASKVNTRASRYAAWKNAMTQANKLLNNLVEDGDSYIRLQQANFTRPVFSRLIDLRRQDTWDYRKEYKSKNQKFPYDD